MRYLILFFALLPLRSISQLTVTSVICNTSRQPLPSTNIVSLTKQKGTSTNENGQFAISGIEEGDSLKITNIGYMPIVLPAKEVSAYDTIVLTQSIKQLGEVKISSGLKYTLIENLGYNNYDNRGEFKLIPGNQIALFIENKLSKEGQIRGISFKLKSRGRCNNGFRIRIMNKDALTFDPSLDILHEDVIVAGKELGFKNYVDLSAYNITMPADGAFVVIEFLSPEINCDQQSYTTLSANLAENRNLVWLNFRDRKWSHRNIPRLWNQNYMTPNIGLKVAY